MLIGEHQVIVTRKPIKHMYLRVKNAYQVHVSVPRHWPDTAIVEIVQARSGWITAQQQRLSQRPSSVAQPMVSGAEIRFRGSSYRLRIEHGKGPTGVTLAGGELIVTTRRREQTSHYGKAIEHWYRQQLKSQIAALLARWQPIMQVTASDFGVRKMKTRWGSCNIHSKKIWLNLELIKKSPESLEYVVVHELTHLYERYHNARFYALMDKYLPDWSERRYRLNYHE